MSNIKEKRNSYIYVQVILYYTRAAQITSIYNKLIIV